MKSMFAKNLYVAPRTGFFEDWPQQNVLAHTHAANKLPHVLCPVVVQ